MKFFRSIFALTSLGVIFSHFSPLQAAPESGSTSASTTTTTPAQQTEVQRLTGINTQLLALMKQLEDLLDESEHQRKDQSAFIAKLEEKLIDAQTEKAALAKELEEAQKHHDSDTATTSGSDSDSNSPPVREPVTKVRDLPAAPKAVSALPPAPDPVPVGKVAWRRIMYLKGTDGTKTQVFHVYGSTWRIYWHNQDPPGAQFAKTSALFIHAFPRDDTVPQEVCAKCGTDGGETELRGPGNFYLVVEASGGFWELAAEDFKDQP